MVHGENRIPYWIDRRLTGLAGPEYHAIISIGLPFEPEDSQYGKSRLEPLLGPLPDLDLTGIDWVIVGGESGPGARPMDARWVREIRDNCVDSEVPFFFKQWGGVFKKKTGRTLDGRTWDEMPQPMSA